jgi:hypothetical protein
MDDRLSIVPGFNQNEIVAEEASARHGTSKHRRRLSRPARAKHQRSSAFIRDRASVKHLD